MYVCMYVNDWLPLIDWTCSIYQKDLLALLRGSMSCFNKHKTNPTCIAYLYCASGSSTAASCSTQVFACSMFPRSKALLCSILASDAIQS